MVQCFALLKQGQGCPKNQGQGWIAHVLIWAKTDNASSLGLALLQNFPIVHICIQCIHVECPNVEKETEAFIEKGVKCMQPIPG